MKKIIKLKNTTIKIDNNFKEQMATANRSVLQKSNVNDSGRFEEMQIYLEEYDVETRRKVKEVYDSYLEKVQQSNSTITGEEAPPEY